MAAILLGMPPNGGTSLNDGASFPGRVVVGDDVVCCSGGARRADMAGEPSPGGCIGWLTAGVRSIPQP